MNMIPAMGSPGSAIRAMQQNPQLGLDAIEACVSVAAMFNLMGQTLPLGFDADTATLIRSVVQSAWRDCELGPYIDSNRRHVPLSVASQRSAAIDATASAVRAQIGGGT